MLKTIAILVGVMMLYGCDDISSIEVDTDSLYADYHYRAYQDGRVDVGVELYSFAEQVSAQQLALEAQANSDFFPYQRERNDVVLSEAESIEAIYEASTYRLLPISDTYKELKKEPKNGIIFNPFSSAVILLDMLVEAIGHNLNVSIDAVSEGSSIETVFYRDTGEIIRASANIFSTPSITMPAEQSTVSASQELIEVSWENIPSAVDIAPASFFYNGEKAIVLSMFVDCSLPAEDNSLDSVLADMTDDVENNYSGSYRATFLDTQRSTSVPIAALLDQIEAEQGIDRCQVKTTLSYNTMVNLPEVYAGGVFNVTHFSAENISWIDLEQ